MIDLTPQLKKELLDGLKVIDDAMHRQGAEKSLIAEEKKKLRETFQLNTKVVNRLAKTYHKSNFKDEKFEFDEFQELYEKILPNEA